MKKNCAYFVLITTLILSACDSAEPALPEETITTTTVGPATDTASSVPEPPPSIGPSNSINTGENSPEEILAFARTQLGVPYLFASTDPAQGFDCSGFITYVFNHFGIYVPRSSIQFTNEGTEVDLENAAPGDLILFTGTDSTATHVGHMGIVENRRNDTLFFIHSSSGKANGVVITPFQRYYEKRFVKVIRVFPERYFE
jgi:cell wall-associated NlpC family hydrolase